MPIGVPYGDIFDARTPSLDKLGAQLYAEQKQRELDRRNQLSAMDNEFSKNVAGIRDADVGDVTKAYSDWKLSTQQLMKQKSATPDQQLDVLRKKAEMYKIINDSKREKDNEELQAKSYAAHPENFIDKAGELITNGRRLPVSQKRAYKTKDETGNDATIDLTNPDNLLYQDKTNWQPILQKAGGTLIQRGNPFEEQTPDKLQTKVTTYKGLNSPLDYYSSLVGSLNTARSQENLASRYRFTPEEAQTITDEFTRIKDTPAFKAAYGDVSFPASSDLTEGLKTAKLLAMQHAIHNQPSSSFTMKDNKSEVMKQRQTDSFARMAQQDQYTMKHIATSWGYRMQEGKNLQDTVDSNYDADKKYAEDHNGEIPMTPNKMKILFGETGGTATMNGNGDYVRKHGDKIDVLPANQAKIKMMTVQKPAFVPGVSASTEKENVPASSVPSYKKSALINAGWTQDQINKAVKAGKIKVN